MRDVAADVDQIWRNAMRYNADGSYHFDAAARLKVVADTEFASIFETMATDMLTSTAAADGLRRCDRHVGRARVDYRAMGTAIDVDSDDGGAACEGEAAGGVDGASDEDASTSWKPPLWFEMQTDSDDSESEAERKRELKRRAAERKRLTTGKRKRVEVDLVEGEDERSARERKSERGEVAAAEASMGDTGGGHSEANNSADGAAPPTAAATSPECCEDGAEEAADDGVDDLLDLLGD